MKHIRMILQIYKLQGLLKIQKNPAFLKKKYLSLFLYSTYVPHNTYYVVRMLPLFFSENKSSSSDFLQTSSLVSIV